MNELVRALIDESYAAAPSHVLEGLTNDLVHHELPNVPHTIYAELWHIVFWQQLSLDWIAGIETVYPKSPPKASRRIRQPSHGNSSANASFKEPNKQRPQPRTSLVSKLPSAARPIATLQPALCPCATNSSRSPPTTPTISAASSFFARSCRHGRQRQAASPGRRLVRPNPNL